MADHPPGTTPPRPAATASAVGYAVILPPPRHTPIPLHLVHPDEASDRRARASRPPARVAVTGGLGFIGSHVVEALDAAGCAVLLVDDGSHAAPWAPPSSVDVLVADAGGGRAARALAAFAPEAVLHLAARGGVGRARRDPAGHVRSVLATSVAVYEAAAACGAKRLVSASSGGALYGEATRVPTSESARPAPRSAYGAEKLAEEGYLATTGRHHGLRTLALRFGNVYGPRQDGAGEAGVVAITSRRLYAGLAPIIRGDGAQTRDFVHVDDVASACVLALGSRRGGALNVGTGTETSVARVVDVLRSAASSDAEVAREQQAEGEVRRSCLCVERARRALWWEPTTGIEDGLRATYEWFSEHPLDEGVETVGAATE